MDQGGISALGAQILSVAEIFALGRFAPASVQRDYQWEERQCQELFSDLERVFAASELARAEDADASIQAEDAGNDDASLLPDAEAPPVPMAWNVSNMPSTVPSNPNNGAEITSTFRNAIRRSRS